MNCNLCGNSGHKLIYQLSEKSVWKCTECALVFATANTGQAATRLDSERLDEKHQQYYMEHFWQFRKRSFTRGLDRIEKWSSDRGTILDIGSSFGLFLSLAQERGWIPDGIEGSQDEIQFCKERFGIEVEQANINKLKLPDRHYDLVTLWDVLEHSTDPSRLLAAVHQSLKPSGVLLLRVPDRTGLFPKICSLVYTITGGRYKYPLEKLFEFHWFHFDRKTVRALLRKADFRVLKAYGEDYINIKAVGEKEYGGNRLLATTIKAIILLGRALNMRDEVVVIAQKIG